MPLHIFDILKAIKSLKVEYDHQKACNADKCLKKKKKGFSATGKGTVKSSHTSLLKKSQSAN